jgi:hypothetical protein
VPQIASFLVSKVRQKIICGKSKISKNSQIVLKIKKTLNYLKKKFLVMGTVGKMH